MKVCTNPHCTMKGQTQPLCNYHKDKKMKDGRLSRCKTCVNSYYRERNKKEGRESRDAAQARFRQRGKEFVQSLKSPCVVCGWFDYPEGVDFHHKDPATKEFGIGGRTQNTNLEALKAEIDKCVCLCANCHRGVHAGKVSLPNM